MSPNAAGFVTNADERLFSLANRVSTSLNIPPRSVFLEAQYQAATSPCTTEEILTAWAAIAAKGGIPRQLAPHVQKSKEKYLCVP